MVTQRKLRTQVLPTGSFISIPEAFKEAPDGLRDVVKVEFRTRVSENSPKLKLENVVSSDIVLFDLSALEISDIDFNKVARDCELVRDAALKSPEKLAQILSTFQPAATVSNPTFEVDKAFKIAEELGLTEELTTRAGGGVIPLIAIGAALLLAGCVATIHTGHGPEGIVVTVEPAPSPPPPPQTLEADGGAPH